MLAWQSRSFAFAALQITGHAGGPALLMTSDAKSTSRAWLVFAGGVTLGGAVAYAIVYFSSKAHPPPAGDRRRCSTAALSRATILNTAPSNSVHRYREGSERAPTNGKVKKAHVGYAPTNGGAHYEPGNPAPLRSPMLSGPRGGSQVSACGVQASLQHCPGRSKVYRRYSVHRSRPEPRMRPHLVPSLPERCNCKQHCCIVCCAWLPLS